MAVRTPGVEFCRLRVYLDDAGRTDDQPTFELVVDFILNMGLADVTVIRGVQATTSRPRPTVPIPVIVEAIGPATESTPSSDEPAESSATGS
jgi:PII-like signaling protein